MVEDKGRNGSGGARLLSMEKTMSTLLEAGRAIADRGTPRHVTHTLRATRRGRLFPFVSSLPLAMGEISLALRTALAASPDYELVVSHLSALLLSDSPPFIFVHDPENARLTSSVVTSALDNLASQGDAPVNLTYSCVNAVACFSSRILFDTALNALAGWTPDWDTGALNWPGTADGRRHNENFDSFVHGIQEIYARAVTPSTGVNGTGKGKGKASEHSQATRRLVLVVDRAERLRDNLPDLLVPLTRLSELVSCMFLGVTQMNTSTTWCP